MDDAVRILRAGDGEPMGDPAGVQDRFLVEGVRQPTSPSTARLAAGPRG